MRKGVSDPLRIYGQAFLLFLYGPVLMMPLFSLNDSIFPAFPLAGFTLKHYRSLAHNPNMIDALMNSIALGLSIAVISTVFGLLAALAVTRFRMPGRTVAVGAIVLPLVVPSIIVGVALLVILRRFLSVELSLLTIGAGHLLLCVPFSMLVLMARLEGFDRSLEEASNDLGETAWMTFWRVTFPLALPGILASLLMSFTVSFDEFVLAFFLSGTDTTLPVYIFSQLRFPQRLPSMLALGSVILGATTIVIVSAELLRRRGVRP
ncbi:MAG: ABC transporter permease, partial [Aestuariivirgaceae bacterium]